LYLQIILNTVLYCSMKRNT